jgi:hypothetical protein
MAYTLPIFHDPILITAVVPQCHRWPCPTLPRPQTGPGSWLLSRCQSMRSTTLTLAPALIAREAVACRRPHVRLCAPFLRAGSGVLRLAPMPARGGQAILAVFRWSASWRLLTQSPQQRATGTTLRCPLLVNPDSVVAGHRRTQGEACSTKLSTGGSGGDTSGGKSASRTSGSVA